MGGWEVLHRGKELNIKYNSSYKLPFKTNRKNSKWEMIHLKKNMQD
jgi:hypothetical protein